MNRSRVLASGVIMLVILLATVQHVALPGAVSPSARNVVEARGDDPDTQFLGPLYDLVVLQEYRALQDASLEDAIRRLEATGFGDALPSIVNRVLAAGRVVLLFFYADWCHYCNIQHPTVEALAHAYADTVCVIRVNEARNPEALATFAVSGFPTVVLIHDRDGAGHAQTVLQGYRDAGALRTAIDAILGSPTARELEVALDDAALGVPHHTCDQYACFTDCTSHLRDMMENFLAEWGLYIVDEGCGWCLGAEGHRLEEACTAMSSNCRRSWTEPGLPDSSEREWYEPCVQRMAWCAYYLDAATQPAIWVPECQECLQSEQREQLRQFGDLAELLGICGACCQDPMNCPFGDQTCTANDPTIMRCFGNGVGQETCQECEWVSDTAGIQECPSGTHCVEGVDVACSPSGECQGRIIATCERDEEDDDGDDDGDGNGDGEDDGEGGRGPSTNPGGDNPDDNDIEASLMAPSSSPPVAMIPTVGIVERGYYLGVSQLLTKLNEPANFVHMGFSPALAAEYSVLIVPSGGLYGLGSSQLYRERLETYVEHGGTLIVLSQQRGDDYAVLPGGELEGFGWVEDQSCQSQSVGMSTYHPVLAGLEPSTRTWYSDAVLSLSVDGYFTQWPTNATVLLSRTKNGMPAMLLYPYGEGWVVVITSFMDYLYAVGRYVASQSALLLRNLLTWAKASHPIPTYSPDTSVDIPMNITNYLLPAPSYQSVNRTGSVTITANVTNAGNTTAVTVAYHIVDPFFQRHLVNRTVALPPHTTMRLDIPFELAVDAPRGVWGVFYHLYSADHAPIGWGFGGAFTFGVSVAELSTYRIVYTLLDPDGIVVDARTETVHVAPGDTTRVDFTSHASHAKGLWSLDYAIVDYRDAIIDFGVRSFAVSDYAEHPEGWTYREAPFGFAVTSEAEWYLYGDPAPFTFHIWNRGDEGANVTVTWGLIHHSWYGIVDTDWNSGLSYRTFVPAQSYASFNYTLPHVVDLDRLRSILYVDGEWAAYAERGLFVYEVLLDLRVTLDRREYLIGDTVHIDVNVTGVSVHNTYPLDLVVTVKDPDDDVVFSEHLETELLPNSSVALRFNFTLTSAADAGNYRVTVYDRHITQRQRVVTGFVLTPYHLRMEPELPVIYPYSTATVLFNISNPGKMHVADALFNVSFVDPLGASLWNTSTHLVLNVNASLLRVIEIPIGALRLGTYQLHYDVSFGPMTHRRVFRGATSIPSTLVNELVGDGSPHRARGNATFVLISTNDGATYQNRTLTIVIPNTGLNVTRQVQLGLGETVDLTLNTLIPSDIEVGPHAIRVYSADNGTHPLNQFHFVIPESQITVNLDAYQYATGDPVTINVRNIGGVDTLLEYSVLLITPRGDVVYHNMTLTTILAGAVTTHGLLIPDHLPTGKYWLHVQTDNLRTNTTRTHTAMLWITGLAATLTVDTGEDVYRPSDTIEVASQLTNTGAHLENGTLHLDIVAARPSAPPANWTTYVPPPIGTVDVIAFDDDGNAWLSGYGRVVRYRDGEWDEYTAADGLPGGYMRSLVVDAAGQVWVGADGSVTHLSVFDGTGWTWLNETNTGIAFNFTAALAVGPDGDVWVGSRAGGGLHRFNGTHWTTYTMANSGMVSDRVACLAVDTAGTVWLGGGQWDEYGVTAFNGTHWTTYTRTNTYPGLKWDRVDAITVDHDGNVWIGHEVYLYGGISVFNGTHWTTYTRGASQLPDYRVQTLAVDADGQVWAGTWDGVAVFNGSTWTTYTTDTNGLEADDVTAFGVDATGQVLVGYDDVSGVSIFNGSHFARLVPTIIDDNVYDVLVDAEGVVWFATYGGISRYDGDAWTYLTAKTSGLLSDVVYVLDVDHEGHLWAGTLAGISQYNGTGWTSYDEATTGLDLSATDAFAADPYGNLWFASNRLIGVFRFNGTHWAHYNTTSSGLASDDVRTLLVDAYGDLWIATDRGVNWYNGTHWRLYNASHSALGDDDVMDLAVDAQNRIWIAHRRGVDVFDRTTWTTIDPQIFEDLEILPGFSRITVDPLDGVWVGAWWMGTTGGRGYGVLYYDGSTWVKYNGTSGLPSHFVNAIAFDQDRVWFGSNRGASVLATEAQAPSPVLWQANLTLTLPGSTVNTTRIDVDPLGVTGKLYLRGHLYTADGLSIASDVHPFYVVDGDLLLTFDLDDAVYKVGETVTLTGSLRNLDADQAYDGLTIELHDGATLVYQASVDLPANDTHPVAASFVAASTGEHTLEATVAQAGATLVTALDQYTVAVPSVHVEVAAPTIVGWDAFPVSIRVNNTGVVDATVTVNGTTVSLAPGAVQFLALMTQVQANATIAVVCTGDYEAMILVDVVHDAAVTLTLTPDPVYPEGVVAIPYAFANTGSLDVNATVTFAVNGITMVQDVYLLAQQAQTGMLHVNLTAGTYTLRYDAVFGTGTVTFAVVPPDQVEIVVDATERMNGTLRIPVTVTNVGANPIVGQVRLLADVYRGDTPLTLSVGASQRAVWNVSLLGVQAGAYNATVQVLVNDAVLHEAPFTLRVTGPQFVVELPVNASFPWGALANLTVTVRNAGDAASNATVTLAVPGIHEATQTAWISADEATPLNFTVPIPDDLAAGWYPVAVKLNDARYQTTLYVHGANIFVTASLDQPLYTEGANATITLHVVNLNALNLSLFATVQRDTHEVFLPFNLSGDSDTVHTIDVPVRFDGQPFRTVLYAVYLASGRALHIDALRLYPQPPPESGITLYADRQVYGIGDTVTVTVNASRAGILNASAPTFHVEKALDGGSRTYTFTVPPLLSDTYAIDYTFNGYAGSYPFDVDGYAARITAMTLDQDAYTVGEDVRLTMEVEADRAFAALVRVTLYDQFLVPIDRYSVNVSLVAGVNRVEVTRPIPRGGLGLYAINPRIYVDLPAHSYALVTSGARFFDVTADAVPPVITIASPTNTTYLAATIPVNVTVNEPTDWVGYRLDGDANVTLEGVLDLTGLSFGTHTVTVYATDPSGNLGASTVTFTVTVDVTAPHILHTPVTSAIDDQPIILAALVTDDVAVVAVALYYRPVGATSYTRLPMPPCAACIDTYNATIPAFWKAVDVEYYLNATDGVNVALDGSPASPHTIVVSRYPPVVTLSPPTGATHDAVTLTWTASEDADFANYTVYQSTAQDTLGTAIATITDASTTTFTVSGLTPATTYHFTIRVTDTDGQFTDSASVSATTTAAPPLTESPWFYVILALIAIVVVVGLVGRSRLG